MHVEVDLPNPSGKIRQGMFGKVVILLEKSQNWSIPTACLSGKTKNGKAFVYVAKSGVARKTPVILGADNGLRVEVLQGLSSQDDIVINPGPRLRDGARVSAGTPAHPLAQTSADQ
jgi:multidrug efflux pump subunit AcrA (membrane-fusion protein)